MLLRGLGMGDVSRLTVQSATCYFHKQMSCQTIWCALKTQTTGKLMGFHGSEASSVRLVLGDASQLTDCQCIGNQGKMIDLNLTTSIASDNGVSLLILDVSTPNPSQPILTVLTGNKSISLGWSALQHSGRPMNDKERSPQGRNRALRAGRPGRGRRGTAQPLIQTKRVGRTAR